MWVFQRAGSDAAYRASVQVEGALWVGGCRRVSRIMYQIRCSAQHSQLPFPVPIRPLVSQDLPTPNTPRKMQWVPPVTCCALSLFCTDKPPRNQQRRSWEQVRAYVRFVCAMGACVLACMHVRARACALYVRMGSFLHSRRAGALIPPKSDLAAIHFGIKLRIWKGRRSVASPISDRGQTSVLAPNLKKGRSAV